MRIHAQLLVTVRVLVSKAKLICAVTVKKKPIKQDPCAILFGSPWIAIRLSVAYPLLGT